MNGITPNHIEKKWPKLIYWLIISAYFIVSCTPTRENNSREAPDQIVDGIEVRTLCYGQGGEQSQYYLPAGLSNGLNTDQSVYLLFPRGTDGKLREPALRGFDTDNTPMPNGRPVFRIIFRLCQHVLTASTGEEIDIVPAVRRYRTAEDNSAIAEVLSLVEEIRLLCELSSREQLIECGDFNQPFSNPLNDPSIERNFIGRAAIFQINVGSSSFIVTTFGEYINVIAIGET